MNLMRLNALLLYPIKNAAFVYRLVPLVFNQVRGVQLSYAVQKTNSALVQR